MSVRIQIHENYYLRSDPLNWIISKKGKPDKEGKDTYTNISFHAQLIPALDSLGKLMLKEGNATTLAQLQETAENVSKTLSGAYTGILSVQDTIKIEELT